jgi:hypothetical protein
VVQVSRAPALSCVLENCLPRKRATRFLMIVILGRRIFFCILQIDRKSGQQRCRGGYFMSHAATLLLVSKGTNRCGREKADRCSINRSLKRISSCAMAVQLFIGTAAWECWHAVTSFAPKLKWTPPQFTLGTETLRGIYSAYRTDTIQSAMKLKSLRSGVL